MGLDLAQVRSILKIDIRFVLKNLVQVTGPQQSCKEISIPKKSILYKYRIDLDLATMLWARKNIFNLQSNWFVHARLDASLQYGKDYFMTECDIFRPDDVQTWNDVAKPGHLVTRLLVGQGLGARASSVIVKTQKLLHQFSLEPCLALACRLCDFAQVRVLVQS